MKKVKEVEKTPIKKEKFDYPPDQDIFNKAKWETGINPDDKQPIKDEKIKPDDWNEKDYNNILTGEDLDVPGAELDDEQEEKGSEDEENNYYSLGGDKKRK